MMKRIFGKINYLIYGKLRTYLPVLMIVFFTSFGFSAAAEHTGKRCEKNNFDHGAAANISSDKLDIYNRLAHDVISSDIENGFIIGFEKFTSKSKKHRAADKALYEAYLTSYTGKNSRYSQAIGVRNFALRKFKIDPKWPVVSHIIEYKNRKKSTVLNPYKNANGNFETGGIDRSFQQGLHALEGGFLTKLRGRIKSGNYTHIIFISMGWNNDQGISLCRYDALMQETKKAMKKPFKPLIVGFTWPSVWLTDKDIVTSSIGHLASVFNKANDADEIGVLHGNLILNRLIPSANVKKLPVVVIGHSYGARLAGRAIYSRQLLKQGALGDGPDLALLLQPAYSAQRHMVNKGLEGYPFAPIEGLNTTVFVTSSKRDKANPLAIWSRHFGGFLGLWKANKNPDIFRVINQDSGIEDTLRHLSGSKVGIPNVIDASKFIIDHNDIYDNEAGRLLAELLIEYTYIP